jgi:hypothetical protein
MRSPAAAPENVDTSLEMLLYIEKIVEVRVSA